MILSANRYPSPDHARRECAMLIVCPTCSTTYQIQLAALGAAGRSVRCSHCKNTWFATQDSVIEEVALADASVPARQPPAPPQRQGEPDDFDAMSASDFSVEAEMPPETAGGTEKPLAEMDAPPLAPGDQVEGAQPSAAKFEPDASEDIETIAARRARQAYTERKAKPTVLQRIASLPVLIVALAAILIGVVQGRTTVVRHFPQTASLFSMLGMPVNLRGLTFQDVKSKGEFHDGVMVLVVEGVIVNLTRNTLEVPRLRFSLRNGANHEVYAWTALPSRNTLGSGDGLAFRTRLASPPADGRDVIVRFFNRRDAAVGVP
jgi:predicted Zn finger-like uncharacterized protein